MRRPILMFLGEEEKGLELWSPDSGLEEAGWPVCVAAPGPWSEVGRHDAPAFGAALVRLLAEAQK